MPSDEKTGYINFDEYINSEIFFKNNIYFAPALHGKLEFGISMDILVKCIEPDCLAVELPHQAKAPFIDAVNRFPYISVLCVESAGPLQYQVVEPQDPTAAAVRRFGTARSGHIHFIDHFCENYGEYSGNFPDSYSLKVVGYERYCREYYESQKDIALSGREPADIAREQYMAATLQSLSGRYKKILFVCGLYHYPAIFKIDHEQFEAIVSFTATYTGQAVKGETVEVSGIVEQTQLGVKRIVIGSSREAHGEYIKVIRA